MLLYAVLIAIAILLFIILCDYASELVNQKIFRVDANNRHHVFTALICLGVATYSLLLSIEQSFWFVLGSLVWFSIAFYLFKKAKKIADTKN